MSPDSSERNYSRYWRNIPSLYNILGEDCPKCGITISPVRDSCPSCGALIKEPVNARLQEPRENPVIPKPALDRLSLRIRDHFPALWNIQGFRKFMISRNKRSSNGF